MGIEYFLVNKETTTFYHLGKGWWSRFDIPNLISGDVISIAKNICEDVFQGSFNKENDSFIIDFSSVLKEFISGCCIKDLVIINDCSSEISDLNCFGYKCVGSIYKDQLPSDYDGIGFESVNTLDRVYRDGKCIDSCYEKIKPNHL